MWKFGRGSIPPSSFLCLYAVAGLEISPSSGSDVQAQPRLSYSMINSPSAIGKEVGETASASLVLDEKQHRISRLPAPAGDAVSFLNSLLRRQMISRQSAGRSYATVPESTDDAENIHATGLDVHGAEPIEHRFTTYASDGSPDVEFQLVLPLTPKRHKQLEHMLEEGYSPHEAYTLLAGGEILAHIEAMKTAKSKDR